MRNVHLMAAAVICACAAFTAVEPASSPDPRVGRRAVVRQPARQRLTPASLHTQTSVADLQLSSGPRRFHAQTLKPTPVRHTSAGSFHGAFQPAR
jgi:hypothetical protein